MTVTLLQGDNKKVLKCLTNDSVDCVITSPPYWGLRDYGHHKQLGMEATPEAYTRNLVMLFREIRRVLHPKGTVWLNLGDCYVGANNTNKGSIIPQKGRENIAKVPKAIWRGVPEKNLIGIPWRTALALQKDGWYLRSDIVWNKPNPMPESVKDRPTRSHEFLFLLAKSKDYFYDADAILEPYTTSSKTNTNKGRNKRSVWVVANKPLKEGHFAVYPKELITPCILAGCPEGGTVLDPFFGAGTTGIVANQLKRNCIGIEINPEYIEITRRRLLEERQ